MSESEPSQEENQSDDDEESQYGNSLDVDFGDEEPGAGLDDPPESTTVETPSDTTTPSSTTVESDTTTQSQSGVGSHQSNQTPRSEIPHRVRADSPKDERTPINVYLSSEDEEQLEHLNQVASREFDETVYKIDVRLAALRSSLYNEAEFLRAMEEIGYGFFD